MRLVTKLTLSFLGISVPIVGVGGWLLVDNTQTAFEQSFEARVSGIERGVQQRLKGIEAELERALDRIADDPIITRELLEPLGRNRFYGQSDLDYERAIVRDARRLMTSAVLDTLRIVDLERKGHVIALGHRTGLEETDAELLELIEKHPEAEFFRHERTENEKTGGTDEVWTLQVAHIIGGGPGLEHVRVALVGGRIVDWRLVDDLRVVSGEGTALVLDDVAGRRVAATFEGPEPPPVEGGYASQERALHNPTSPETVAKLRVFVPRTELEARREALWTMAIILAASVVAAALLMGFIVARRMSKPLEALALAAGEVALGRRGRDLPVRGNDEVAQLTRAFNQMTHDLERSEERLRQSERVAAWREIARRIAHEIKNPLSPIQMSIEMLKKVWDRKHPEFEKIFHESTATILEEVGRMKRIVSEFSDFARMPSPRPAATDLGELASQVVSLLRETAPGIDVQVAATAELVAQVDPDQLRQALLNLVKNAIEAVQLDRAGAGKGRERGRVEVRVEPDGSSGMVRIVVTDNGPGMTAETKQKLFTPYFTTKASGTGLGLAIVHRIVEEHEGSIQVDSELGMGTRFVVRLPLR